MYDGIQLLVRAIDSMLEKNKKEFQPFFRNGTLYNFIDYQDVTRGIHCSSEPLRPWAKGEAIRESVKAVMLLFVRRYNIK